MMAHADVRGGAHLVVIASSVYNRCAEDAMVAGVNDRWRQCVVVAGKHLCARNVICGRRMTRVQVIGVNICAEEAEYRRNVGQRDQNLIREQQDHPSRSAHNAPTPEFSTNFHTKENGHKAP